jgi:hypothetical protein
MTYRPWSSDGYAYPYSGYSSYPHFPPLTSPSTVLPSPKKALYLTRGGRNGFKTLWAVNGVGVSDVQFDNYLHGRLESWTTQGLNPKVRPGRRGGPQEKFSDYKVSRPSLPDTVPVYLAIVEFPSEVEFSYALP